MVRISRTVRGIIIGGIIGAIASAGIILLLQSPYTPLRCGAFGPEPCPGLEALNLVSSKMTTPTNVTLNLWNTGSAPITLSSYVVKDHSQNQYSSVAWSGPTISPNERIDVNIFIDGTAFRFQTGNDYTVAMVTSRNNQFVFTVIV